MRTSRSSKLCILLVYFLCVSCQSQQEGNEQKQKGTSRQTESSVEKTPKEKFFEEIEGKHILYRESSSLGFEEDSSVKGAKYLVIKDSIVTAYVGNEIRFVDTLKTIFKTDGDDWSIPEFQTMYADYVFAGYIAVYVGGMEGDLEEYTD
ncbi:MAG: hypothetical protein ACFB0B_17855 [Thermonemataceae bacterium]